MEEIILTGYSKKEFSRILKREGKGSCYLCKRKIGDEGVFIVTEGSEEGFGTIELEFEWFEITKINKKFRFPICHECQLLLEIVAQKIEFHQRVLSINKN